MFWSTGHPCSAQQLWADGSSCSAHRLAVPSFLAEISYTWAIYFHKTKQRLRTLQEVTEAPGNQCFLPLYDEVCAAVMPAGVLPYATQETDLSTGCVSLHDRRTSHMKGGWCPKENQLQLLLWTMKWRNITAKQEVHGMGLPLRCHSWLREIFSFRSVCFLLLWQRAWNSRIFFKRFI